ncbi:MAG: hypothetical protein KDD69_13405 [Bdellovibrionales bacterium]|nr:hypothetical protein [Bdellovibrionales bacterium]
MNELTDADIERFSRQLLLSSFSEALQQKLFQTAVSTPVELPSAAAYLTAAGLRHLQIEITADEQLQAAEALREHLQALDPESRITIGKQPTAWGLKCTADGLALVTPTETVLIAAGPKTALGPAIDRLQLGTRGAMAIIHSIAMNQQAHCPV